MVSFNMAICKSWNGELGTGMGGIREELGTGMGGVPGMRVGMQVIWVELGGLWLGMQR